jgi:hypothetical protein
MPQNIDTTGLFDKLKCLQIAAGKSRREFAALVTAASK